MKISLRLLLVCNHFVTLCDIGGTVSEIQRARIDRNEDKLNNLQEKFDALEKHVADMKRAIKTRLIPFTVVVTSPSCRLPAITHSSSKIQILLLGNDQSARGA